MFPALSHVAVLAKGVGYLAGYNLRFLTIAQSISQLNEIYGTNGARAFATNHALQIVFAPREQHDANEYSEMLGYLTAVSVSKSRSGRGSSTNRTEHRRALMLPQELKELGPDKEIVLYENTKPILADRIFYYKDPVFAARLLPAPAVRRLDVMLNLARAQGCVRPATEKDLEAGPEAYLARLAHNLEGLPRVHDGMNDAESNQFVGEFLDRLQLMPPGSIPDRPRPAGGGDAERQMVLFSWNKPSSQGAPAQLAITR